MQTVGLKVAVDPHLCEWADWLSQTVGKVCIQFWLQVWGIALLFTYKGINLQLK